MEKFSSFIDLLTHHAEEPLFLLLILMAVIWTTGRLFTYLKLPHILGEIMAGIVLGPSVLGIVQETEIINVLADLGIFFLMFHAGLDTDLRDLKKGSKTAFITSLAGILAVVAGVFGIWHLLGLEGNDVFMVKLFAGFILAAASFPIIMRMLRHFGLKNTPMGATILSSTVFTEIILFVAISMLLALYSSGEFLWSTFFRILIETVLFFGGTIVLGKFILPWFGKYLNRTGTKAFTFSLIVALCFGLSAELIGLHFILGAYLGGIFVREEIENEKVFAKIEDRYFGLSYSFLGPVFFALVGIKVSFEVFETDLFKMFAVVGAVLLAQMLSAGMVARWIGKYSAKKSLIFAAALVGRGAIGVVLTEVGYQVGILDEWLYSFLIGVSILLIFACPLLLEGFLHKSDQPKLKI